MTAQILGASAPAAPRPDGLGGEGDLEVTSDVLRAVFSAVDRASGVSPTGGTLIDLHLLGRSDHMNEFSQLAGLAQGMRVAYTSLELAESTAARVVVRATGHVSPSAPPLGEDPLIVPEPGTDLGFVTEYTLTCGTPIVHVRSTLTNNGTVSYRTSPSAQGPRAFGTLDVMLWGTRSIIPFCPVRGQGDRCPPFDIANPIAAVVGTPLFGAMGALEGDPGSFAFYSPENLTLLGIHDPQVSSFGRFGFTDTLLGAGQSRSYSRAIAVGDRSDVASALDPVLEDLAARGLREIGTVTGRVTMPPGESIASDPHRRPMVVLASPGMGGSIAPAEWTPNTMVRVEADGTFQAHVPAGEVAYEVRVDGRAPLRGNSGQMVSCGGTVDLGSLAAPAVPTMRVEVRDVSGTPVGMPARVVVYGAGTTSDPDFGPSNGPNPAGNVAYTDGDGLIELRLPGGTYEVFATHGPFYSLGHAAAVVVDPTTGADVQLDLVPMPVLPAGWITADFHVHSAASFDSSLPMEDRVRAFIAEGVQAIVATEHDALFDYGPALTAVEPTLPPSWRGRLRTFVGVESTAAVPTSRIAHTIGHHNAFPLTVQSPEHGAGAPRDEGVDVGPLYEALRAMPSPASDVLVQLNHARSIRLGDVWIGYFDSCGFDPTAAIDTDSLCFAMPGTMGTNAYEFDAMEVINGRDAISHVRMMNDWFSLLRQSPELIRPVGTANSDSHELVVETAGYPMTLLRTSTPLASLDDAALVGALSSGAVTGSLGVVIEAEATGNAGPIGPGLTPVAGGAIMLSVRVTAAPWVPVDQIRVRLGGVIVATLTPTFTPTDPYSTTASVVRFEDTSINLTPLLPTTDTFITVEAGFALAAVTDTDGDGVVDVTEADVGPVPMPFGRVVRDARPIAFTNPIYVDVNGGGYVAPGSPLPP